MGKTDNHTIEDRTFVYRTDAENKIIFLNQEWVDFAQENQASELTDVTVLWQPLESFITGWETRHLYEIVYERVRRTGKEVCIPFRCDSPEIRRKFQMRIFPLENGGLEFNVKVLQIERRPRNRLLDRSVEHASEFVVICSWCKRIQIDRTNWAEIEDAAEKLRLFGAAPPSLTHGVCPDCLAAIRESVRE